MPSFERENIISYEKMLNTYVFNDGIDKYLAIPRSQIFFSGDSYTFFYNFMSCTQIFICY